MKNYFDALKRRKAETGESGFSLIELIVVVVILGVLAAIAIPIFNGLQADAEKNAVRTVAANGASQVAAQIAKGDTLSVANLADSDEGIAVSLSGTTLENYCVTATKGDISEKAGPCPAPAG